MSVKNLVFFFSKQIRILRTTFSSSVFNRFDFIGSMFDAEDENNVREIRICLIKTRSFVRVEHLTISIFSSRYTTLSGTGNQYRLRK